MHFQSSYVQKTSGGTNNFNFDDNAHDNRHIPSLLLVVRTNLAFTTFVTF